MACVPEDKLPVVSVVTATPHPPIVFSCNKDCSFP